MEGIFDVAFVAAIACGVATYTRAFSTYCKKKKMWSFVEGVTKEERCARNIDVPLRRGNHRVSNGDARVDDGVHFGARRHRCDASAWINTRYREHSSAALMVLHIFACTLLGDAREGECERELIYGPYALPLATFLLVSCQMTMTNMGWSSDFTRVGKLEDGEESCERNADVHGRLLALTCCIR